MALCRWVIRKTKRCCVIGCAILLLIAASLFAFGYYMIYKGYCTDEDSKKVIKDLCDLYKQQQIAGSLCSALCDKQTLHYQSCANYKEGKRVIFMVCDTCGPESSSVPVVFKMKNELNERAQLDKQFLSLGTPDQVLVEIDRLVRNSFNFLAEDTLPNEKDILSYVWGWDIHQYAERNDQIPDVLTVAFSSVWSLTDQQEYLLSRYLQNNSFIPKIYGTCGPAYFVENTETLGKFEYEFLTTWTNSWRIRASIALRLVDVVNKLETFHPRLHLCDVKSDNFGLRKNGEVTLIDTDCAMFEKNLRDQFFHSSCTSNEDCDFFDCRGICDTLQKKCLITRTNNNMQSLCEDVFIGYFSKLPTGLLRDPPGAIKVELFKLLQECAFPESITARHAARESTKPETVQALQDLLRKSIGEQ